MNRVTYPGYQEYQEQRYAEAYPKLLPVAESGHAEAQSIVGLLYQMGLGVDVDEAKAMHWYKLSSEQGYGVASNNLAGMLAVRGQKAAAARLYALSREQGFKHGPTLKG